MEKTNRLNNVEKSNTQWEDKNRMDRFYDKYISHITEDLSQDEKYFLMKQYIGRDTFSSELLSKVLKFAGSVDGYKDIKAEDLNIHAIASGLKKDYFSMKRDIALLRRKILSKYSISPQQYYHYNIDDLLVSSDNKIQTLLKSDDKLSLFMEELSQTFNTPIELKNNYRNLLPDDLDQRITARINSLWEEDKKLLQESLDYFANVDIHSDSFGRDLCFRVNELRSTWVLTDHEIVLFVSSFIPEITLQKADKLIKSEKRTQFQQELLAEFVEKDDTIDDDFKEDLYNFIADTFPISTYKLLSEGYVDIDEYIHSPEFFKIWKQISEDIKMNELQSGISSFEGFLEKIESLWSKISIKKEDMVSESTIELKTNDNQWNILTAYYEICWEVEKSGEFLLISKWVNAYRNQGDENTSTSYEQLAQNLIDLDAQNMLKSCKVYSKKSFQQKILNKDDIELATDDHYYVDERVIQERIDAKIDEEIEQLEDDRFRDNMTQEEKRELYRSLPEYKETITSIEKNEFDFNRQQLENKMNELDPKGIKYSFKEGTTIQFVGTKNIPGFFVIEAFSPNSVQIRNEDNTISDINFHDFVEAFTSMRAKRIGFMHDSESLFSQLVSDDSSLWSWYAVKDNKIVKQTKNDQNKEENTPYEMFIWDGKLWGEYNLIQVHKVEGNQAVISFWKSKYEGLNQMDKDEWDKKNKWSEISLCWEKDTIPLGVLYSYFKQIGAVPRNLEQEAELSELPDEVKMKWSFLQRLFHKASVRDVLSWGKMILESIENRLKDGSDEIAAQWASKLPLWESLSRDIQTRLEQAGRKRADEFKDRLKVVDSSVAIKMIKEIITSKDAPEAKKEAALLFMAENYGNLYTKGPLFEFQWKFLWYTSLWGKVWDKLYREVERSALKSWLNFTEHDLLVALLWKQCKWDPKFRPKRRSKLHKEYKAMMWSGKESEFWKGEKDSEEKRTFEGRLYGVAFDELFSGAHMNALGAWMNIIGKWDDGNVTRLETLPFVMAMSWLAYDFDQDIGQKYIMWKLAWGWIPSAMGFFLSSRSNTELYNKTVVEVSSILASKNPDKYGKMGKKARTLLKNSTDKSIKPKQRGEAALEFYEEYGDILSRTMNMLNTGLIDEDAQYEKMIFLEANKSWGNPVLKQYYNTLRGYMGGFVDFSKSEWAIADAYAAWEPGTGGVSWMNPHHLFQVMLKPGSGGSWYRYDNGAKVLDFEIRRQLEAYKEITYENPEDKKKIMKDLISAYFYSMVFHLKATKWWLEDVHKSYQIMKILWVQKWDLAPFNASDFENIVEGSSADRYLDKCIDRFLKWEKSSSVQGIDINNAVDSFKKAANDIQNQEYENKQVT